MADRGRSPSGSAGVLTRPEPPSLDRHGERSRGGRVGRRAGLLATLGCVASYLVLGVLANLPAWQDGPTRAVQAGGAGDIGQEIWFLGWVPHALFQGLDPLVTTWVNYPWGATLMDNTAMPLAGVLGAPVTFLFGPVATYNVLFSLAFAGSATAAFLVFLRWTSWKPGAYLGGLLYGFSPYMVGQGNGHLFLLLAPLLPLVLACLDELLVRQRHRAWSFGALLGLLAVAQLELSAELLAWAGVLSVTAIAALALLHRGAVRSHLRHAAAGLGVAVAVFALLAAFPLSTLFTGPDHDVGAIHPGQGLTGLAADAASFVVPTANERVDLGLESLGDRLVTLAPRGETPQPDPAENGSYLGIPLIALLAVGALWLRRDRVLRFALLAGGLALVFSLGSRLRVDGHAIGPPLPFALLERIPFLDDGIASRFSVLMWLFVALALVRVLDGLSERRSALRTRRARQVSALALGGLLGLVLVSLLPSWPYDISTVPVPPWFTSSVEERVPEGSVLLTYPIARQTHNEGMLWQALDDFRYRIPAGEEAVADTYYSPLERVFDSCYSASSNLPLDAILVRQLRHDLAARSVGTVVVPDDQPGAACAVRYLGRALGRTPSRQDGASVWSGVAGLLKS